MRRFALLLVGVVFMAGVVGTLGVWVAANALGVWRTTNHARDFPIIFLLLAIVGVIVVARGLRRMTRPFGSLVEAAGHIQEGDYTVRVPEWGSPDSRSVSRAFNAMSARLEETDKQRRSFLADVTHELRTPLSIIRGQAEGITDGVYPGDAAHMTPIIEATQTLERLVDDLRTLALAETGNLRLNREPVDLALLVNESVASFQPQAQAKGVDLRAEVAQAVPTVSADPVRIRSVLANLLGNALAHTPGAGSIRVLVEPAPDSVAISVRDTGPGIPADLLPRVFDRFVRGSGSTGSGLGLAIAKDIVSAHGGTIAAESTVGKGTTVRFTLPRSV
ncbi:MAG: HAMP domain-containing sensor histidine kinase [Candidatus Dormibacter sp.]